MSNPEQASRTLTGAKVGAALGLSASTIQGYARNGRIPFDTTPGGHRRYNLDEVRAALGGTLPGSEPVARPVLPLAVREGSIWCWEPLNPDAREECRITATRWDGEQWWIQTEATRSAPQRRPKRHWNELDRFVEAATLVRPGPGST